MVEVYYYIPKEEVENAVECGLKLSEYFDKEVVIGNTRQKCISALLNPKDDMEKYRSESLRCVKLELPPEYCFVADKYLYEIGLNDALDKCGDKDGVRLYKKMTVCDLPGGC